MEFSRSSGDCRSIVPVTAKRIVNSAEWLPALAVRIAARSVPGPESASEVTVRLTCEGTMRPSNASSLGRKQGDGGRFARVLDLLFGARLRSQEENNMMVPLSRIGPR